MSIQDWGAIGELVAAVATVATLIYLAIQIRHNSLLAKTQYQATATTALQPYQFWRAESTENARIYRKGMMDWYSISPDERMMLDGLLHAQLIQFMDLSAAYDRGLMDAATFRAWTRYVVSLIRMPGAAVWWSEAKNFYEGVDSMIGSLEAELASTPPCNEIMPLLWVDENDAQRFVPADTVLPPIKWTPQPNEVPDAKSLYKEAAL